MARVSYTSYQNSVLATILSFLSSIGMLGGVALAAIGLFSLEFGMVAAGVLFFLIFGLGFTALAELLNKLATRSKWWKNQIRKTGLEARIPTSVQLCFDVYNAYPCPWTLEKIQALNPSGAEQIRQALANKQ